MSEKDKNITDSDETVTIEVERPEPVEESAEETITGPQPEERHDTDERAIAEAMNEQHRQKASADSAGRAAKRKADPLSFDALRKEHDLMLLIRSVLIMVTAAVLCIPMPPGFLPVKFLIFILLAYATMYNENMIGEEASIRQDSHSKKAHILSYVAMGVVVLLFMYVSIRAGVQLTELSTALNEANQRLTAIGLQSSIVK